MPRPSSFPLSQTVRKPGAWALLALVLVLVAAACSTTKTATVWKDPQSRPTPLHKVTVVFADRSGRERAEGEEALMAVLREAQVEASSSSQTFPLEKLRSDPKAAAAQMRATGSEAALVVRLLDGASYTAGSYQPSRWEWSGGATGSPVFADGYTEVENVVAAETILYDLSSVRAVWRTTTHTVVKETADVDRVVDAFARKMVDQLRRDGWLK